MTTILLYNIYVVRNGAVFIAFGGSCVISTHQYDNRNNNNNNKLVARVSLRFGPRGLAFSTCIL